MILLLSQTLAVPIWAVYVLAAFVLVFGTGRFVRVVTYDDFPPTVWWRMTWNKITDDGPWSKLFSCFWCFGFWAASLSFAWFVAAHWVLWLGIAWWAIWGVLALSYTVSMLVARDEPAD